MCARLAAPADFARFDHLLAMDENNLSLLARDCPQDYVAKLALFMRYGMDSEAITVPDPYYGGARLRMRAR